MPDAGNRRRKTPKQYELLVIPSGHNGRTRRWHASISRIWIYGVVAFVFVALFTVGLLSYTPLGWLLPIENPEVEKRYGRQIKRTQDRLNSLAEQVMVLRDYNQQLRKALGEEGERDTSKAGMVSARSESLPPIVSEGNAAQGLDGQEPTASEYDDIEAASANYGSMVVGIQEMRATFPLLPPTVGFLTQGFNPAVKHFGVDYAAKSGTPIYAASQGQVIFAGWTYEDGNMIILSHGSGYMTVYKHCQTLLKNVHDSVKRGEPIALLGGTGKTSLGPHLHFEVLRDGVPQDPKDLLLIASKM